MLTVQNLSKKYSKELVVNNISFQVNEGEIAILLGPNGAGKSTTIKCIAGLLKYDGYIEICNHKNKSVEAKKLFSYVPEVPAMFDLLTVYEHIEYMAAAYGINNYKEKAEELLKRFDLIDKRNKLGKELSKGMMQKVSICCALIINPKVVLFDEPLMGLDPKAIKELKKAILELREKGSAILISTHIIDSVDDFWDKVLIMKNGNIVLSGTKQELMNRNETLEELFFDVTEDSV
ncbi:ABC transporter ATP-binding protein [Clostridium sp. CM028]|uniref:ABC transporter ATP-binding protein n=1 Tax=unclassified Clostridium TaxID=2614128 RepID=UPI001C0D8BA2|nr:MULTISPECIES: ABC transporter ATP-binding protein [unclassified Clostridium]MBU3093147.1 ABC transporter ATP-binding protein [Clostridium sp. CF011]MBW9147089.1 ABC transporter ATP-binding protein [Clostridium sp. CM027]MBW9150129.1 ABC transporter ATP-binding protein [Clostridium sp. CM028]UVE39563.1 ABC transporter ATP-binding protein [Clostridium sp. CM027]WAG68468.1 ABC transporter ATP-binding protein [Clostridium sp. CF011]